MNRLLVICTAAALCAAGYVDAATKTWSGAVNNYDWTNPGNYQGGLPSAGDTVELPDGASVQLNDAASFTFVNTLDRITPASNATLTVTLAANVTNSLEVPFTAYPTVTSPYYGRIVKTGGGTLFLNSMKLDNGQSGNACKYLDYYCRIDITEGDVAMKQNAGSKNGQLGVVTVSAGATLFPYADPSVTLTYEVCATYFAEMWGSGSIRAMTKPAGSYKYFWLHPDYSLTQSDSVFEGDIGENLSIYANGRWQLTGTQSTCNPGIQIANGRDRGADGPRLAVAKLGKENETSSIGKGRNQIVSFRSTGGYLLYTGTGETTDRKFHVQSGGDTQYPSSIDGGIHGGLDIAGDVSVSHYQGKMERLVLTGADSTTNKISGALTSGDQQPSSGGLTGGLFFIKRGLGVWRFADVVSGKNLNVGLRENRTGFTIEEGTLQFASLADTNRYCSLGLGTRLQEPYGGAYDTSHNVDYFFRLGRTNATHSIPTLELSGLGNADWGVNVGTRKVAMAGSGRISNASTNRFRLGGVSALAGGEEETKYLYLGGTRDGGDEILDLTDGAGKLGVVKDGSGTWTLGGDVNFTGLLDVQEGTLVVKRYSSRNTWFRFTAPEMLQNCDDQYDAWAASWPDQATKNPKGQGFLFAGVELGLFDRDGNLITRGITNCWKSCNVEPGGVGYDRTGAGGIGSIYGTGDGSRTLDQLFDGSFDGSHFWHTYWANNGDCGYLTQDNPNGWTPVVFRLTNGAPEVASWDLGRYYNIGGNAAYREITAAILESSPDGVNWTTVTNMTSIPMATSGGRYWSSDFSTVPSAGVSALHTGWPVQGDSGRTWTVMPNTPVKVASGATLRADISADEAAGKPVLSNITISSAGNGTIDGFAFAANGTLNVEGVSGGSDTVNISFTFTNATALANLANWSVQLDGEVKRNKRLSATENGIVIFPYGLRVILR